MRLFRLIPLAIALRATILEISMADAHGVAAGPAAGGSSSFTAGRNSGVAADTCLMLFSDYGDAPESFPAYPFLSTAHFPSCASAGAPGTQEIECGTASSTPPDSTRQVIHLVGLDFGIPFWLGCGAHPSQGDAGDGESGAKTSPGGATSACEPIAVDCFETGPAGMSFGQDECLGDSDAGVVGPIEFASCGSGSLRFRATVCPALSVTAYTNVLVDWNQDGDWNDNVACGSTQPCAREWPVKNERVTLTPGCSEHVTPTFGIGPRQGPAWMRVTLTSVPVPDNFPWAGSAGTVNGDFPGGETEDYLVTIGPPVVDVRETPSSPAWLGAQPNPFRETTAIRYALTRAGRVRIDVIDVAGRRVRTLVSGVRGRGDQVVTWDGTDDSGALAPAGVYVVRFEAEQRTLSRRLLLVR